MKFNVELKPGELKKMGFDTVDEFKAHLRNQLDNGVATDDGESGQDWMVPYELDVTLQS